MPTYEYECTKCGHGFERFQSMTAEPLKRCPLCRCKVKRVFGVGAGIIFKGSGFYATDYRSSNYTAGAKKEDGSAAASSDKKETASSEKTTKPAAKSGDA